MRKGFIAICALIVGCVHAPSRTIDVPTLIDSVGTYARVPCDLESAFMLIKICRTPAKRSPHRTNPNLRRVLLGLTQHHLYYSVASEETVVEILALWHTVTVRLHASKLRRPNSA